MRVGIKEGIPNRFMTHFDLILSSILVQGRVKSLKSVIKKYLSVSFRYRLQSHWLNKYHLSLS